MDFRLIRAFCAVYEEGSINKAAASLRIAQPNISVAIKNLEFDLRAQLFERSSSGTTPTPIAHAFYSRVKKALDDLEAAHQALAGSTEDMGSHLRVGLPEFLAKLVVPEQLPSLLAQYPDIELRLVEGTPQWLIDLTIAHEIDLAVILGPPTDTTLSSHRLAAEPFVLVSSDDNQIVPRGPVDVTKTTPLKLALPWGQGSVRSVIDPYIASGQISVSKIVGINTLNPIIDLVRHTDWMTILPASALLGRFEGLAWREIVNPQILAEHYAIQADTNEGNPALKVFIQAIAKTFEDNARAWMGYGIG